MEIEQREYPDERYDDEMGVDPRMMDNQAVYPNQDQGFLKWLFDFRKEAIIPLRKVWRGKEFNFDRRQWHSPPGKRP